MPQRGESVRTCLTRLPVIGVALSSLLPSLTLQALIQYPDIASAQGAFEQVGVVPSQPPLISEQFASPFVSTSHLTLRSGSASSHALDPFNPDYDLLA